MMVGLPGSGKSTWATKLTNYEYFSSDEYRKNILGDVHDQSNNVKVFDALNNDVVTSLLSGKNCVYDATNITVKDRKHILEKLKAEEKCHNVRFKKLAIVVATSIDECLRRNSERERTVPEEVIWNMAKRFQFPMKYEGFDDIDVISYSMDGELIETLDKAVNFDQKNPHHTYKLMEHCLKLAKNYSENQTEYLGGVLHDIGKLFTQRIDDNGVAHYYNHDSIGAYYLVNQFPMLVFLWEKLGNKSGKFDDIYDIIFFVNWHMRAHNDFSSEKAEKKYRALFGDNLFDRLMTFAEYDKVASGTYQKSI